MAVIFVVLISVLVSGAEGFGFLMGGGGCGCCPPPPPPCVCSPPPPPPPPCSYTPPACPCGGAKAHDEKTVSAKPLDELELRAQMVAGLHLNEQPTADDQIGVPRQLELLERLGEEIQVQPSRQQLQINTVPIAQTLRYSPTRGVRMSADADVEENSETETATPKPTTTTTTTTAEPSTTMDPLEAAILNNEDSDDVKCNSHVLKKLMIEKMTENSAVSKRQISAEAERVFGGSIDVVCSRSHFSYVYSSSLFCEASKGEVTCIAFRQNK